MVHLFLKIKDPSSPPTFRDIHQIDIHLQLFDQMIVPILLYGSEVWWYENIDQIETFHLKICKQLLKLNKTTANCMVYGELGRHKIAKTIESRMVNFWFNILTSPEHKLSHMVYKFLRICHDSSKFKSSWIMKIKNILDKSGMSYLYICKWVWFQGNK